MTHTELYDRLGVSPDASLKTIKETYRRCCKTAHPDQGGDRAAFESLTEAYEILMDPEKRKRYDATGRTDEDRITEKRIRDFINITMRNVIEAENKDGSTDDPTWVDVRNKIILSLRQARKEIQNRKHKTYKKLERATRVIERFKKRQSSELSFDPVGDALSLEVKRLNSEMNEHSDAIALSEAVEKVLDDYLYDVGPGPEGQFSPGPTTRRTSSGVLLSHRDLDL